MTDHSIGELRRQYEAARNRRVEAQRLEAIAGDRLHEAQSASTGLIGKVAIGRKFSIVVERIEFFRDEPSRLFGPKIKKYGTASSLNGIIRREDKPTFKDRNHD